MSGFKVASPIAFGFDVSFLSFCFFLEEIPSLSSMTLIFVKRPGHVACRCSTLWTGVVVFPQGERLVLASCCHLENGCSDSSCHISVWHPGNAARMAPLSPSRSASLSSCICHHRHPQDARLQVALAQTFPAPSSPFWALLPVLLCAFGSGEPK